jgi:hypothetical protein
LADKKGDTELGKQFRGRHAIWKGGIRYNGGAGNQWGRKAGKWCSKERQGWSEGRRVARSLGSKEGSHSRPM